MFKNKNEQIMNMKKGPQRDKDALEIIGFMREFATQKQRVLWEKSFVFINITPIACGVMVSIFLIIFHQSVAFGRSEHL